MGAALVPVVTRQMQLLAMVQKEYPNYHPVLAMARIAHHEDADLKTQLEAHKAIVKYIEPELKSVEVRSTHEERRLVRVSLFDAVEIDGATGEITQVPPQKIGENW